MGDLEAFGRQCDISRAIVEGADSLDAIAASDETAGLLALDHDPHDRGIRPAQRARRPVPRAHRRGRGGVNADAGGDGAADDRGRHRRVTRCHHDGAPLPAAVAVRGGLGADLAGVVATAPGGPGSARSMPRRWLKGRSGVAGAAAGAVSSAVPGGDRARRGAVVGAGPGPRRRGRGRPAHPG